MYLRTTSSRFGLLALSTIAALSILATSASAGHGRGNGWGNRRGGHCRPSGRVVVREPVYAPTRVYAACAPRYVTYRPQRVVVVRPAPYVRVGGRFGSVDISAIFGQRRHYDAYEYGCNFCDAHFASYGAYERHVHSCSYRPANYRIQCRNWDDAGYDEYRAGRYDDRRYGDGRGYDSNDGRYDDDRGYQGNDGYDEDGYYGDDS